MYNKMFFEWDAERTGQTKRSIPASILKLHRWTVSSGWHAIGVVGKGVLLAVHVYR